jgi:AraC family transcriptional regulator, regulatory protein of adaptative response / methylated-DNA-[protein]-cysteine methyltransferase
MFDAVTAQTTALTDEQRYQAFVARDRSQRDAFVIGVVTTGVYCRAGCPARAPRRENVRFFETAGAARAAGLRACKRCRPDEAAPRAAVIAAQACRTIEQAETAPALEALARQAGLSPFHFHRLFKAETGITPSAYAAQVKDRRAKAALNEGASVTAAVYDAGYGSSSRFYEAAGARFGMAPKAWRDRGRGEAIRVAVAPCSLGFVLVGATARGICAVELGDEPEALKADFARRFSGASVESDAELAALVETVVGLIEQPRRPKNGPTGSLPLDVRGTAFQERVWRALRDIPAGETRTYAELAAAIGAPKAVRAVGAACGANPVAVVTPCHRVVGSDGKLTGYRWGVERKKALLDRER